MYDTLRELHRKFWKELPVPEVERQYDEAFRELMRRLEKPERKMVLRLLDTRGLLAENAAFDSFACGFRLALELTTESQQHKKERSEEALAVLCATEEKQDENLNHTTDNRCGVAAHGLWASGSQFNRNDIAANTGGAGRSTAATSDT